MGRGRFVEVKHFGTVVSEADADRLSIEASKWIRSRDGQLEIDFEDNSGREREETERVVGRMSAVLINGSQLLLSRVYDRIGFSRIKDEILRHLVIARVSQPASKLATVFYLKSYYDEDVDLNAIYRYIGFTELSKRKFCRSHSHQLKSQ